MWDEILEFFRETKKIEEDSEDLGDLGDFSGGWWNYRFIEHKEEWTSEKTGNKYYDITFGVKEVYYRGDGSIVGWTENDIGLGFYGHKEVKSLFKSLKKAAKMTVLKEVNDKMIDTGKRMKDYTEEELCNFDWKKEM